MYRVEDKYCCSERDMLILQSRIGAVLKSDAIGGRGYKVTSVYFDDYNDSHLKDSLDGVQARNKYRIRIYNDSFETIKLEVKYKYNNRVLKKSRSISKEELESLVNGSCIEDLEKSIDSPVTLFNIALQQDLLRPSVVVEYDRAAFVYDYGNTRITFDRNVRSTTDFTGFLNGNRCSYHVIPDYSGVLEVKYDEFIPGFIMRLLELGNMNQTSFSKYALCRNNEEQIRCLQMM